MNDSKPQPRRRWPTRLAKLGIAVIVLVIALAMAAYAVLWASLPATSGEKAVAGIKNPVRIHFDWLDRPYVEAETLSDAFFAQGWLHASNRLWQMEMFRRAGKGRLAELLGTSMLAADQELWRIGVPQMAKLLQQNATPELSEYVTAYVKGVNAAIEASSSAPPEMLLLQAKIDPWQSEDVFALGALMAYQSANNFRNELLRLALREKLTDQQYAIFLTDNSERPDFPFIIPPTQAANGKFDKPRKIHASVNLKDVQSAIDRLAATDPSDSPQMPRFAFGSNGWVVAPWKTQIQHALFAFDSHDELGIPNLFYEVHLFIGKERQIRGWSVAGLPGVINGYNERIAWGFTNIGDTQDLFLETRSPENPLLFRDGDDWYEAKVEVVSIPVKGRAEPESLRLIQTKNGVLISEEPPIALRWTTQDLGDMGLDSMLALNRAQNWEDFNAALDRFAAPSLNATYADVDGNIGFRTAGILPTRGAGVGLEPLPGDKPENRWTGIVPAAEMPRLLNPDQGFLAAANARVNAAGNGPLVSADNAAPYRIQRLQNVLRADRLFDFEDMQRLQFDWHDGQAELLLTALLTNIEPNVLSPSAKEALEVLNTWQPDLQASQASAAALLFQQWYLEIAKLVFEEPLGQSLFQQLLKRNYVLNHALDALILNEANATYWQGKRGEKLATALNQTVEVLAAQIGPEVFTWRLDALQHVALSHELGKAEPMLAPFFNLRAHPWGGGPAVLGRANYRYDRPFHVSHGATLRFVAEMRPVPSVQAVMTTGQSGHPLSDHYSDQFQGWLEGDLYPIDAAAGPDKRSTLTLTPR